MQNQFLLSLVGEAAGSLNVFDLVQQAGWVVKGVMLLLLSMSIFSWAIIFSKTKVLRAAASLNRGFSEAFWSAGSLTDAAKAVKAHQASPLNHVFETGLQEFNQISELKLSRDETLELVETNLARSLEKSVGQELQGFQKRVVFLASTSSSAPFIGLFGTVWGIMTSFINIGATGASNLAVVAPGIAEALIATAIGLFTAIPAALFYNYTVNEIKKLSAQMRNFSTDFLNTAKRSI